jgi:hypothetical protein
MLQFFATLPGYVRAAFIGGGSMITGFSSKLPDNLQVAGLWFGIALVLLGVLATVWHALNVRRIRSGRGKIALDPSTLLPTFAVIAFVGVAGIGACLIWQAIRPTPGEAAPKASMTLNPSAGELPSLPPTLSNAAVLDPKRQQTELPKSILSSGLAYSTSAKEKLLEALSEIDEAYSAQGRKLANEASEIARRAGTVPWDQLDVLREYMKQVGDGLKKINDDIESVRAKYPSVHSEIAMLLRSKPVQVEPFIAAVDEFSNMMYVYRNLGPEAGDHGAQLGQVLESNKRHLFRAGHHFQEWMNECDMAINHTRAALKQR